MVLQEGPEEARSPALAGMGWASRSSRSGEGPAGMAACPGPGCRGQHPGGSEVATEGTAAVRPLL